MGKKLNTKEFISRADQVHSHKYDYSLVEYKTNKKKVTIICPHHGEFKQRPFSHLDGEGCRTCYDEKQSISFEDFFSRALSIHRNKYAYQSDTYQSLSMSLIIICPDHGEFRQAGYAHLKGQGCPSCNESKGEREISNILDRNEINYIKQWRDHDCSPNGKAMAFDFYLPDSSIVIEYDGEQHFLPIKAWGGVEQLIVTQNRDSIKDKYCKDNGITMIRISYKDSIMDVMGDVL